MAKLTPQEYADKHNRRLKGAMQDVRSGIERVNEAPTAKAAAQKDKMRQNLLKSLDDGKWERGLKRVSLDEWKSKTLAKVDRIPTGIDEAHDKVVAFAEELLPHIEQGQREVEKMPNLTLEDNINRATSMMRHMAKFKRTK